MVLDSFFDLIFGWAKTLDPTFGLFFVTAVFTLIITLIYKYTTNQQAMKESKGKVKEIQAEMKNHRQNPSKMMELQKEAMTYNMKMMKQSFIPMIVSFVPIIILFGWLRESYSSYTEPLFGYFGWIGTYIIFSLILTFVFRKILKVY